MYSASNRIKELLEASHPQGVVIQMQTTEGTRTITGADIVQGSFAIDRYCVSGNKLEIGSACASELTFRLNNTDGRFDEEVFEGAELFVRITLKDGETTHYIPCGYFTIDNSPRKLAHITISALDRMVQFEKDFVASSFTFPTTVGALLNAICTYCNVPFGGDNTLPNYNYIISTPPEDDNVTCRNILQWIGEITGTCAYIDWNGDLQLKWYTPTDVVIQNSNKFKADIQEQDIVVSGVRVVVNGTEYTSGTLDYAINIEGNPLIQGSVSSVISVVADAVENYTYRPFTAETKPFPYLYPLDQITHKDKDDNSINTVVTHINYRLNGRTVVRAVGETVVYSNYASRNPLTKHEKIIIDKAVKEAEKANATIDSRYQSVLKLNETINGALGLYQTVVTESNGTESYYFHNEEDIADSNIIYTYNSGGFAWTDDWNDGSPVWQYGFSRDGNAVLRAISAYKITASEINIHDLLALNATIGGWRINPDGINYGSGIGVYNVGFYTSDYYQKASLVNSYLTSPIRIYAGGEAISDCKFAVLNDGSVYMEAAKIAGDSIIDSSCTILGTLYTNNIAANKAEFIESYDASIRFVPTPASYPYLGGGNYVIEVASRDNPDRMSRLAVGDEGLFFKRTNQYSSHNDFYVNITDYYLRALIGDLNIESYSVDQYTTIQAGLLTIEGSYGIYLGLPGTSNSFRGTWYTSSGAVVTSDRNAKHDIEDLPDKYSLLFDNLRPVRFKYNDGTSDRYHTGFVAQEVHSALEVAGLSDKEFAGVCIANRGTDKEFWGIRDNELISLIIKEVQQLKKENAQLNQEVAELKNIHQKEE